MLEEARPGYTPPSNSRLVGANFENIYWKKKCYFTLFLDEAEWDFYSFPADKEAPIVFVEEKSQIIDGRVVTGPTLDKNVSFFDAEKIKIAGRNAVRCINYKKRDAAGADNETGTVQSLAFEIYLRAPFASGHSANPYITMIIDPPGNNDGPP